MKKLCLVLAALLALCACAAAETVEMLPADFEGLWNMEYSTSDGYMVQPSAYGFVVTMQLEADGDVIMDYAGEVDDGMSWFMQEGKAYISGFNTEYDVEMTISDDGVLEITDEVGSMFFTRIAEDAEQ